MTVVTQVDAVVTRFLAAHEASRRKAGPAARWRCEMPAPRRLAAPARGALLPRGLQGPSLQLGK
jgi:hypothetical protein